jgi:HlyD family secretion protein
MRIELPVKDWQLLKSPVRWTIPVAIMAASVSGVGLYQVYQQTRVQPQVEVPVAVAPAIASVTALGRLEPQGEVIKVTGSSSIEGSRVAQLLVKQGEQVKTGQLVAILDSRDRLQAGLEQAKQDVRVAEANLAKVQAGAKAGELAAQRAEIARLQAQLEGEINTQRAEITRWQEQLEGERKAQQATIARLQAQQTGDAAQQRAEIARLQAQLDGERKTQQATIARLQAQLLGEKRTQQAAIARLSAQQQNAQTEFRRYEMLSQQGAIAASRIDTKRLELETAFQQLNEAKANLSRTEATLTQQINEAKANLIRTEATLIEQINEAQANRTKTAGTVAQQINEARANLSRTEATLTQQIKEAQANRNKTIDTLNEQIKQARATLTQIAEVRPTDVNAAQAEIDRAKATVKKAQADLDQAFVRSPIDGQVLKIHTKAGESVSSTNGIADIGQTGQMYAIAEVYESDIAKVKLGQAATINSETNAFEGELKGTVAEIGLQIGKKDILNTDPAADVDARVVEVKIQLDPESSRKVSGLTYSKVIARIIIGQ